MLIQWHVLSIQFMGAFQRAGQLDLLHPTHERLRGSSFCKRMALYSGNCRGCKRGIDTPLLVHASGLVRRQRRVADSCVSGWFWVVVSSFGLKTFNEAQHVILAGQIARILKRGGQFALIEASDPKTWVLRPVYRFYLDRVLPLTVFCH
ncbi:class I SAM-dependent methyltransferase [Shimia sp. NS0008-38b]|uniref:class I SAM-dependent methyltransferase n=1 Tax=Shimia sp. NS0008-38b TaxID=3127653 RepID=UPI0033413337